MAGDNGRSTGSTSLMVPSSTAAGENHARFLKCRPSLTLPFIEVPTLAHIRLTVTHCDPENPPLERTARVGSRFSSYIAAELARRRARRLTSFQRRKEGNNSPAYADYVDPPR